MVVRLKDPRVSRTKYRVRTDAIGKLARTHGNVLFDSFAESAYARELDRRQARGEILRWERQVKIDLVEPEHERFARTHKRSCIVLIVDFLVRHSDGSSALVEVKGKETAAWILKKKLFKRRYPAARLVIATVDRRGRIEEKDA